MTFISFSMVYVSFSPFAESSSPTWPQIWWCTLVSVIFFIKCLTILTKSIVCYLCDYKFLYQHLLFIAKTIYKISTLTLHACIKHTSRQLELNLPGIINEISLQNRFDIYLNFPYHSDMTTYSQAIMLNLYPILNVF